MLYRSKYECETDRRYVGRKVDDMVAPREGDCEEIGALARDLLGPHVNGLGDAILPELRSRIAFLVWENLPEEIRDYLVHTESDYVPEIAKDRWDMINDDDDDDAHIDNLPSVAEMLESPQSDLPYKFIDIVCEMLRELGEKSPTFKDLIEKNYRR